MESSEELGDRVNVVLNLPEKFHGPIHVHVNTLDNLLKQRTEYLEQLTNAYNALELVLDAANPYSWGSAENKREALEAAQKLLEGREV